MNNDDRIDHSSSAHELEEILRTFEPRGPRIDVESICEALASRPCSTEPRPTNSRFSLLAAGASCVAGALIGAAMVFFIMGVQILSLKKEIAHLSQQRVASGTDARVKDTVPTENANVEPSDTIVAADWKPDVSRLPQLLQNEVAGNKLTVGSHLKLSAYRQPIDVSSLDTIRSIDRGFDASDVTPNRPRPATRATLIEDLLDT
jgi:hypothetical protein